MSLNSKKVRELRATANRLSDSVVIGKNGLTENVIKEIAYAFKQEDLLKIRYNLSKEDFATISAEICEKFNATVIKKHGKTVVLFCQEA